MIFSAMQNDSKNILSLLPHRPPFVMISKLIKAVDNQFESEFYVLPETLFVEDGLLTEAALIENIAQTCAAGFGYLDQQSGEDAKIGFIGSISRLKVHHLPPVNCKIITKTKVTFKMGNIFVVKGENFLNDEKLVECEMKIVVQ